MTGSSSYSLSLISVLSLILGFVRLYLDVVLLSMYCDPVERAIFELAAWAEEATFENELGSVHLYLDVVLVSVFLFRLYCDSFDRAIRRELSKKYWGSATSQSSRQKSHSVFGPS